MTCSFQYPFRSTFGIFIQRLHFTTILPQSFSSPETKCSSLLQPHRTYGSKTKIQIERHPHSGIPPNLQPHLRTCYRDGRLEAINSVDPQDKNNQIQNLNNMEFVVSFLGTGGGAPSRHRNGSSIALRTGGQTFLFDACEGTGRQLSYTPISPLSVTKIFISHLHGDHLYGIVPLILNSQTSVKAMQQATANRKSRRRQTLHPARSSIEIFGPPGLYNYINMTLALSCAKVNYLNVDVVELVGGRQERGPNGGRRMRGRNIFLSHYPEIETEKVRRKYLEMNPDGTWTIDAPEKIDAEAVARYDGPPEDILYHRLPNDVNLGKERRFHIKASELDHLHGVQTFGYTVEEQQPPAKIDPGKATALGLKPSKKYNLLKCGVSVPTDDGLGEVHPDQVMARDRPRARKIGILADHRRVPERMAKLCADCDILVHEATLSKCQDENLIKIRGHTTAHQAGLFAKKTGCKVLALNHFGTTSFGLEIVENVLKEARDSNEGACPIIASHDFMEIWVPRGGFNFDA